jgi:hypothetical protein
MDPRIQEVGLGISVYTGVGQPKPSPTHLASQKDSWRDPVAMEEMCAKINPCLFVA